MSVRSATPRRLRGGAWFALAVVQAVTAWSSICAAADPPAPSAETPAAAPAEDSPAARARARYEAGRAAYDRGEYDAAADEFLSAYELTRTPILAFNIAQARRLAHRCEEALAYYRLFRDSPGVELPSDFEDLWKRTEACAHDQAAARSRPDERARPTHPAVAKRTPSKKAETRPAAPHPRANVDRARPRTTESGWTRWAGIASLAAASGTGIAATVFTIRAARAAERTSELSKQPGGVWDPEAQANEKSGRSAAAWAEGLFPVTAVLAGAGVWLLVVSRGAGSESAAIELHASPVDVSARVRYRF